MTGFYRGAGGTGDATGDAVNEALAAIEAKNGAIAAQNAAAASATAAATSASAAATSAVDATNNGAYQVSLAAAQVALATTQANNAAASASAAAASAIAAAGYSIPSQTGQSGKFLKTDGTVTSWATVDALPSQTGNSGKFLTTDGTNSSWGSAVTSISVTSPVASTGGTTPTLSLASGYGDTQNPFASKTANYVLAAPNGSAGAPSFRALAGADIPTLNQNTTGTAGGISVSGGWAVTPSGTKLYFSYNGVNKGSLDSSGNFIVVGNVTAYGTP